MASTTPTHAFGYIRVSTTDQATDGVSLDAQKARIEAWCTGHGYELKDVFVDAGISGGRADNRPALQDALNAVVENGGVLVVYSLSRLARSTKDTLAIADRLDRAEADLVSLTERIDTTSAAGRMVFRMLAVLSEFERDLVSERTTAAMTHKRLKNERVGTIPFGYELAGDGVTLVQNIEEQRVLTIIAQLRDSGVSYRAIAEHLNASSTAAKNGGQWFASSVRSVLATHGRKAA